MNSVSLTGRLTKDPEIRWNNEQAFGRFTLAVDRPMKKDEADFIPVVCFGKTAELVEKYCQKGKLVGVTGRIQTGSYEKDGKKVYTTDVIGDRIEFLSANENKSKEPVKEDAQQPKKNDQIPMGFDKLSDEDIPF